MTRAAQGIGGPAINDAALLALLADAVVMKTEARRELAQALSVARDALRPLADNVPVSGPAQRAMVTIALMALGQAQAALKALEDVDETVKKER